MAQLKILGPAAIVGALLGSSALADVTPEEVWADWQRLFTDMGYTLDAGAETREDDTLVISDLAVAMPVEHGVVTATSEEFRLRDMGDGRVEIIMAPELPLQVEMNPPEEEPVNLDLLVTTQNYVMIAGGEPEAVTYDYTADSIGVTSENAGEPGAMDVVMNLNDVAGEYRPADDGAHAQAMRAGGLTLSLEGSGPEGDAFAVDAALTDLEMDQTTAPPFLTGDVELGEVLREGGALRGTLRYGASTIEASGTDAEGAESRVSAAAEEGSLGFTLDRTGITYAAATQGTAFRLRDPQLPMQEIAGTIAETGTTFTLPLIAAEEPQRFALATRLVDLVVNDEVWGLFDAEAVLPREPLTVILDLDGAVNLNTDLTDEQAVAESEMPGEPEVLTLNELRITGAGTELTGTGSFTFDNTDTETFDGFPRPLGSVDLRLVGGNALIDRLVQLGFIPQDQAMGARMMMSLFARPGEGEDTLTSTIEVREDGGVYANGQRIR